MSQSFSPMPPSSAAHFTAGWPATEIPTVWIETVESWTKLFEEMDPNFKYSLIHARLGTARVWVSGNFERWDGNVSPGEEMSKHLSRLLQEQEKVASASV